MLHAMAFERPRGFVSYVGVPHAMTLDVGEIFPTHVHLRGTRAVRRYPPDWTEVKACA